MLRRYLALLVILFSSASLGTESQSPAAHPDPGTLVGSWRVEIEGEERQRDFAVFAVRGAGDTAELDAAYGWMNELSASCEAVARIRDGKVHLEITTPALSTIQAQQIDANTILGTFTGRWGSPKNLRMSRIVVDLTDTDRSFADEDKDYGVAPKDSLVTTKYHSKTPLTVPGARTIKTLALKQMMSSDPPPIIVDVLNGKPGVKLTLPSAVWLAGAGDGRVFAAERERFAKVLASLTGSDKSRPIVFLCFSAECWLSYNAALRAVGEGYTNVYWHRGGLMAWKAATLPFVEAETLAW